MNEEKHEETHNKKQDKITISKTMLWQTVSALLGILLILSVFKIEFISMPIFDLVVLGSKQVIDIFSLLSAILLANEQYPEPISNTSHFS